MHTNFLHKLFEHPQGSGTSRQNSQDIPGSSLRKGRQTFEGGHELFGHRPFAWKTPTPPGGLRTQKVNLCALFSFLISVPKLTFFVYHSGQKYYKTIRRNNCFCSSFCDYCEMNSGQGWFSGRGWGQQLFTFQSPAVHWMARTSSLNCLSCRNPYQTPHSLNCLPPLHWKTFFSLKSASSHPLPKNRLWVVPEKQGELTNISHASENHWSSIFLWISLFFPGKKRSSRIGHWLVWFARTTLDSLPRQHTGPKTSRCRFYFVLHIPADSYEIQKQFRKGDFRFQRWGSSKAFGGHALKQALQQPTETPTSTVASLGPFPTLVGPLPRILLNGQFSLLKIPSKTAPFREKTRKHYENDSLRNTFFFFSSEFLRGLAPSKSPGKNDLFKGVRMKFLICSKIIISG